MTQKESFLLCIARMRVFCQQKRCRFEGSYYFNCLFYKFRVEFADLGFHTQSTRISPTYAPKQQSVIA